MLECPYRPDIRENKSSNEEIDKIKAFVQCYNCGHYIKLSTDESLTYTWLPLFDSLLEIASRSHNR